MEKRAYIVPRMTAVKVEMQGHLLVVSGGEESAKKSLRYGGDDEGNGWSD